MAEELRTHTISHTSIADGDDLGTALKNVSENLMHIRRLTFAATALGATTSSDMQVVASKSATFNSASSDNGSVQVALRTAYATPGATIVPRVATTKTVLYPKGAYTLETGEELRLHQLATGTAFASGRSIMDIEYHY